MNILQKTQILQQVLFQLPLVVVAFYVINRERKLIWQTLKSWWKWMWNWKKWPPERKNSYLILAVGVMAFFTMISLALWLKTDEMIKKNKTEMKEEMVKDGSKTKTEIEEQEKKKKAEEERFIQEKRRKPNSTPFFDYAPFYSFLTVVIIAPIAEECLFRYLIFKTWGKKNPLAYIFSGTSFIFAHFATGGGILNFRTVGILFITYLPMTLYFIYAYWKSKWNICYPIYAHLTWNLMAFLVSILVSYRT